MNAISAETDEMLSLIIRGGEMTIRIIERSAAAAAAVTRLIQDRALNGQVPLRLLQRGADTAAYSLPGRVLPDFQRMARTIHMKYALAGSAVPGECTVIIRQADTQNLTYLLEQCGAAGVQQQSIPEEDKGVLTGEESMPHTYSTLQIPKEYAPEFYMNARSENLRASTYPDPGSPMDYLSDKEMLLESADVSTGRIAGKSPPQWETIRSGKACCLIVSAQDAKRCMDALPECCTVGRSADRTLLLYSAKDQDTVMQALDGWRRGAPPERKPLRLVPRQKLEQRLAKELSGSDLTVAIDDRDLPEAQRILQEAGCEKSIMAHPAARTEQIYESLEERLRKVQLFRQKSRSDLAQSRDQFAGFTLTAANAKRALAALAQARIPAAVDADDWRADIMIRVRDAPQCRKILSDLGLKVPVTAPSESVMSYWIKYEAKQLERLASGAGKMVPEPREEQRGGMHR